MNSLFSYINYASKVPQQRNAPEKKTEKKHPSSSSSLTGKIPRAYEVWRPLRPRKDGRAGWGGGRDVGGGGVEEQAGRLDNQHRTSDTADS